MYLSFYLYTASTVVFMHLSKPFLCTFGFAVYTKLPPGKWTVTRYDLIRKDQKTLSEAAEGDFSFDFPDSQAVFVHIRKTSP